MNDQARAWSAVLNAFRVEPLLFALADGMAGSARRYIEIARSFFQLEERFSAERAVGPLWISYLRQDCDGFPALPAAELVVGPAAFGRAISLLCRRLHSKADNRTCCNGVVVVDKYSLTAHLGSHYKREEARAILRGGACRHRQLSISTTRTRIPNGDQSARSVVFQLPAVWDGVQQYCCCIRLLDGNCHQGGTQHFFHIFYLLRVTASDSLA
jgi:hypothetical protein